jgi:hypothetical protein
MVNDIAILNGCIIVVPKTMILCVIVNNIMYGNTSMMKLECQLWFFIYTDF